MSDINPSIIASIIETLVKKESASFRKMIQKELATRIHTKLEQLKKDLSSDLLIAQASEDDGSVSEATPVAPSAPITTQPNPPKISVPGVIDVGSMPQKEPVPGNNKLAAKKLKPSELKIVPTTAGSVRDDISLDPNMEKEFFVRTEKYKNQDITLKQVGTGLGKPVRAYINNRRWEFFPGPDAAMEASRVYVDQMMKDIRRDPDLGMIMTNQIRNDRQSGVALVPAPLDAGKPNEIADAELKRKQAASLSMGGGTTPPTPGAPGKPSAPAFGQKQGKIPSGKKK